MSSSISQTLNFGAYLPTTSSWEIQQIQASDIDPKLKEVLIRIYQQMNNISNVVNYKETGIYDTNEFLTGQIYFPIVGPAQTNSSEIQYRPAFRKSFNIGPLPDTTTFTTPHQLPINDGWIITRIFGTAFQPGGQNSIPLPYPSTTSANIIEVYLTNTVIGIITAADYSSYNAYITIDYIPA